MEAKIDRLKTLIEGADKILVTSHTSPDPDALASLLLMGTTLRANYPDKEIVMVLEEEPSGLDFLTGYGLVRFEPVFEAIKNTVPGLLIIVDANSCKRVSRKDYESIKRYVGENSVKTAVIDHHEPDGKDETEVYINSHSIAAVQEVYETLFDHLGLNKPDGYAQITMLGLYADSGGFAYASPRQVQTMELAAELVKAGVNVEEIKNRINQFSDEQMRAVSQLTANVTDGGDYTYTFLSDEFVDDWQRNGLSMASLHGATKPFVDSYIRNVGGRRWGFLVYKDQLEGEQMYSVSLRSVGGVKDVSAIARQLDDGGGHKPAAGGRVKATSINDALLKIKKIIASS